MNHENQSQRHTWFGLNRSVVVVAILAVISFFLLRGHGSHVLGILPYLLLLACPFMHFFMHSGHGKHGVDSGQQHDRFKGGLS